MTHGMEWSRQIKVARRGLRTALRTASAVMAPAAVVGSPTWGTGVVLEVPEFGDNPGKLAMRMYTPHDLPGRAPLVVLLHGCGQDAAGFAVESGWIALAERIGLALVLPEQSDTNNRQRCFHWFRAADTERGKGEVGSIRAMVTEAVRRCDSDPGRVFVVGLSAGAAMAAALLAAYPDVFAAGASVAGLPVGAASGAASALAHMAHAGPEDRPPEAWAALARDMGPPDYHGPWPRLSIWHGGLDNVVDPGNADLLARQWCALHGIGVAEPAVAVGLVARHVTWRDATGPAVEAWTIPAMAHGYPTVGVGMPVVGVLPVGLSATDRIAAFWGLL
jgi:poly(hydroxyalkanoate) depolymerase family esterase